MRPDEAMCNCDFYIFMNMGFFVSVCAHESKTKLEVEDYVNREVDTTHKWHRFECVDISIVRDWDSSPSPCPQAPDRTHWFLVAGTEDDLRAAMALKRKAFQ